MRAFSWIMACGVCFGTCLGEAPRTTVRVATFNVEDVGSESFEKDRDRLVRLGEVIRALSPDIVLLNEIAGPPRGDASAGEDVPLAERFVREFVDTPDRRYDVFVGPTNTGVHSGLDLDNNGRIVAEPGSRDYGGDCLGYGAYPGQYGMALLVGPGLDLARERVRMFGGVLWKDMPGADLPPLIEEEGGAVVERAWYDEAELAVMPLASKDLWDVGVVLPDGRTVSVLCSHPTPPVFDGREDRNGRRNHDEIRMLGSYVSGAPWMVDHAGWRGGLDEGALFVMLGDLNADPDEGDSRGDPIGRWLLGNERVSGGFVPRSVVEGENLDSDDTARFRLRVDYVLPSVGLEVVDGGVVRGGADFERAGFEGWEGEIGSDHFPVWVDIALEGAPGGG